MTYPASWNLPLGRELSFPPRANFGGSFSSLGYNMVCLGGSLGYPRAGNFRLPPLTTLPYFVLFLPYLSLVSQGHCARTVWTVLPGRLALKELRQLSPFYSVLLQTIWVKYLNTRAMVPAHRSPLRTTLDIFYRDTVLIMKMNCYQRNAGKSWTSCVWIGPSSLPSKQARRL